MDEKLYLLMQVNDSVFPIGGYTQSYGLETYILKNLVTNPDEVYDYILKNLQHSFTYSELLVASLAFDYATDKDINSLLKLEEIMTVSKTPIEIREASHKLGTRFIKTILTTTEIDFTNSIFLDYAEKVKNKEFIPNHAIAYGIFCASIGIKKQDALSFFLYASTSAMVTNSVKTVPLSQTQGQQILYRLSKNYNEIISNLKNLNLSHVGLSMPGFDVRCMQHECLYSRLYMS